ncbi:2-C-methyl-D-erythritol 2,4-cyclodiphosphate synthase [bacterium]|nr:2-C-methyl-D-erythritol 2,4-cyclodiphosphate synthase [bacterium]
MRVGLGYDIHRTRKGNKIFLGGVQIPTDYGVIAHSDGDIILHALMDGILGALALGDIGKCFPPSDEKYRDVSSKELLKNVLELVKDRLKEIINIDIIINLEKPKLSPYQEKIKNNIANLLSITTNTVNLKIKSGEGIGIIGNGEAISSQVIVLLEEKNAR